MQADAARTYSNSLHPFHRAAPSRWKAGGQPEELHRSPVNAAITAEGPGR
jgi:hypothetical protein